MTDNIKIILAPFTLVLLIGFLIYGIFFDKPIQRVCRQVYMVDRRFGVDFSTHTSDIKKARDIAGGNPIYLSEECL